MIARILTALSVTGLLTLPGLELSISRTQSIGGFRAAYSLLLITAKVLQLCLSPRSDKDSVVCTEIGKYF